VLNRIAGNVSAEAQNRDSEKVRLADDGDELKDMFGKCDIAGYRDFGSLPPVATDMPR
jgi:hypothetical protein